MTGLGKAPAAPALALAALDSACFTTVEVALKDVCLSVTDGDHQAPPKAETGIPFITISAMNNGEIDLSKATRFVPPNYFEELKPERQPRLGDILYSVTGSIGIAAPVLSADPFVFQRHIAIIRPDPSQVQPEYLRYILQSPQIYTQAEACATGTAQLTIPLRGLRDLIVPLPPLPEQRRIVRKLDALSARSTTARTHLTAIEKLVERYKRSVLGQFFPDDLPTRPLGLGCTKIGSGATPRGGKNVYLPEGIPLIRSQNIRFDGFDWDGLAFISDEHADELRNVTVRTGDVLLNITGASIGRVCLTPKAMEGARVNQHVSIIRPIPQELDAGFVHYFLSSPSIQNWIWNENYGVTRQALTKGMIEEIAIPDVSLEEQREIVRRIEAAFAKIDRLAAEAAKALKLLGHLDQRILAKAFAGDLVPQDPTDEPAEALLARIHAERGNLPKKGRKRTATR